MGCSPRPLRHCTNALFGYRLTDKPNLLDFTVDVNPDLVLPSPDRPQARRCIRAMRADRNHRPVGVCLGFPLIGHAPPVADPNDPIGKHMAIRNRVGRYLPPTHEQFLDFDNFPSFVSHLIRLFNIPQFTADTVPGAPDLSFTTWCSNLKQPLWRREQLAAERDRMLSQRPCADHDILPYRTASDGVLQTFTKREKMVKMYKTPRAINARSDTAKVTFGPLIKLLESAVYDITWPDTGLPAFIKHVPVSQRPRMLERLASLRVGEVICSDYTAFESCATPELMLACEFVLYRWICGSSSKAHSILDMFEEMVTGENKMDYAHFCATLHGSRMSGEMNTSLGNGFLNLCIISYVGFTLGKEIRGFVEGDDGIFVELTPSTSPLNTETMMASGALLKMEKPHAVSTAEFCGNIYVPGEYSNLTDPMWFLASASWYLDPQAYTINLKTRMQLLRARAMSGLAEYPGAPVISVWCNEVLRRTAGYKERFSLRGIVDYWDATVLSEYDGDLTPKIAELASRPITPASRALVETVFSVPIEAQLELESLIRSMTIDGIRYPYANPHTSEMWERYVGNYSW